MIATILGNAYRDADKHPAPFTMEDFMPQIQNPDRDTEQPQTDLMGIALLAHRLCGGDTE